MKNEERLGRLFEELVPMSGKCDSLAGELVRAATRIEYRYYNDGDRINVGYGKETCNAAARFLKERGNGPIKAFVTAMWGMTDDTAYEVMVDNLDGAVADYVEQNPHLRVEPTVDMWSYGVAAEDVDDSYDYDDGDDDWDFDEVS